MAWIHLAMRQSLSRDWALISPQLLVMKPLGLLI